MLATIKMLAIDKVGIDEDDSELIKKCRKLSKTKNCQKLGIYLILILKKRAKLLNP